MSKKNTKEKTESTSDAWPSATVGVVDTEAIFQKAVQSALHTLRIEFDKIFKDIDLRLEGIEKKLQEREQSVNDENEIKELSEAVQEIRQQTVEARQ